jgi:RimJ/RimL family protein N-acetyltransferase
MPAIVAPRLSDGEIGVRPIAPADVPDIVAACSDPEVPRWTRVPSPYTREDAERFLAIAATEAAAGKGVALAVTDAGDRLIGTVALMEIDRERGSAEIGYWTAASARGRGAATRAVALLRDWAHAELGLTTIEILPHRDNRPSQRVAERAGFTDSGEIRSMPRMPADKRHGYKVYVWPRRASGRAPGAGNARGGGTG